MDRKLILFVILGCLAMMATGCAKKDPQTATISLSSNPTTGYAWEVTQNPELFDISSEYTEDANEEQMVGVGGTEKFVLTPKESGTCDVEFCYRRSWEEEDQYDTKLSYTLKINKSKQIKVESFRGDMAGDISGENISQIPEFEIK